VNLVVSESLSSPADFDGILAERQAAAAWVSAHAARRGDPGAGDALAAVTAERPDVAYLPVIAPPTADEGALDRALGFADSADLRVVRICPGAQRYPLASWVITPIPELCASSGLALMIDFAPAPPDWLAVLDLARRQPSLPVVVVGLDGSERYTLPALFDAAPNVLVDGVGIERLLLAGWVATFGSHRFVLGGRSRELHLAEDDEEAIVAGNAGLLAAGTWAERWL
jgi:hypothetical protein